MPGKIKLSSMLIQSSVYVRKNKSGQPWNGLLYYSGVFSIIFTSSNTSSSSSSSSSSLNPSSDPVAS